MRLLETALALLLATAPCAVAQIMPQDKPVRLNLRAAPSAQANGTELVVPPAARKRSGYSPTVLGAQRQLSAQGYSTPTSGVLGSRTRSAILQFQTAHALPQTGKLDPVTVNALNGLH